METVLFIIGIILFVLLVVVHELGHAIAARRNGVVVEEFGIGFPPRAWARKLKNGTVFTLNWLPLGGFVKLKGESDDARGKGAYGAVSLWAKTKILLAGVVVNWLTAVVLFTILALVGLPKIVPNQFSLPADTITTRQNVTAATVEAGSPAAKAGLTAGDEILRIDGQAVTTAEQLRALTSAKAGQTVELVYARDGQRQTADVELRNQKTGQLGVGPYAQEYVRATWSAPIVGLGLTAQLSWLTIQGLGTALANLATGLVQKLNVFSDQARQQGDTALQAAGSSVAGPVGIVTILMTVAGTMGLAGVILIIAIISLTLAVMNVLPIPALDGGRLFVTLLFRAMKKPLRRETEEKIHGTGFLVLMALFVIITFVDVGRLMGR